MTKTHTADLVATDKLTEQFRDMLNDADANPATGMTVMAKSLAGLLMFVPKEHRTNTIDMFLGKVDEYLKIEETENPDVDPRLMMKPDAVET